MPLDYDSLSDEEILKRLEELSSNPTPPPKPESYDDIIKEAAATEGVPEELVRAVIHQESGGKPSAVSPVGAQGLMQLMPETAKSVGVEDSFNPEENIRGGTKYLAQMLKQFGDVDKAIAAYNAGPGAVQKYGGIPPFKETKKYVPAVLSKYQELQDSLSDDEILARLKDYGVAPNQTDAQPVQQNTPEIPVKGINDVSLMDILKNPPGYKPGASLGRNLGSAVMQGLIPGQILDELFQGAVAGKDQGPTPMARMLKAAQGEQIPASSAVNRVVNTDAAISKFPEILQKPAQVGRDLLSEAVLSPTTAVQGIASKFAGAPKAALSLPQNVIEKTRTLPKLAESVLHEDPVDVITQAIKEAKSILPQQKQLYSEALSKKVGKIAEIGGSVPGEQGFIYQLGALKGTLPKVQFDTLRGKISQEAIDSLFSKVEQAKVLTPLDKISAKTGLAKLLGKEGGELPTKSELSLMSEVFPQEFIGEILNKRPLMQKVWDKTVDVLNVPKSIMSSFDLSAPFRQGLFLTSHPKEFAKSFGNMFKYALDEKAYLGLLDDIKARPTYQAMRSSGLDLTTGNLLGAREEQFVSGLAEKIPGIGKVIRGSDRAYTGFLNKLRADTFDDLYGKAASLGLTENNPRLTQDIAKFVNLATGRGDLGKLNGATNVLNAAFFSPKLIASRIQLLNPMTYVKLDPFVRKEALKSLVTVAGLGTSVVTLAKLGGADVETNSNSSDFGKIKVGDTHYDPWGGFQQYVVLGSRLVSNKIKSATTQKEIELGKGYKPSTRLDQLFNFLRKKEAPIASFLHDTLSGYDIFGKPVEYPKEIKSLFTPMILQDFEDLYNDDQNLAMGIPSIFGVGAQTFKATPKPATKRKRFSSPY